MICPKSATGAGWCDLMTRPESDMTDTERELHVLALNSGSSSLKFGLYRVGSKRIDRLMSGEAEQIGDKSGLFHAKDAAGRFLLSEAATFPNQQDVIIRVNRLFAETGLPKPSAVGHRIVHGGPKLLKHCLIDDSVVHELEAATVFAPLHMPAAVSVIRFAQMHFPGLAQVACFDTAFHAGLPDVARLLPIPRDLQLDGIHRYGFHGISCESIVRRLGNGLPSRLIIAHLGNGASVTAVKDGRSIDTSMGLTPTGGVIMGTRSGELDPGVLIYLMREKKFDAGMLEDLVNRRSGLIGISGVASDMRRLHEAASSNASARLAIEMFCYSVRKQLAAMIAALDGADMVVFTGGIGENDWQVRAAICGGLNWIGVSLDDARNRPASNPINDPASRCTVQVLASQEEEQIARLTWAWLPQK